MGLDFDKIEPVTICNQLNLMNIKISARYFSNTDGSQFATNCSQLKIQLPRKER